MVSLFLTSKRFHKLSWCFHCLLWKSIERYCIERYVVAPPSSFSKVEGDLMPKIHPCLMILWKKSLVQSFAVFWSVLTKLWSNKVLNQASVTSYPRMYKTFHPWFSLPIFVNFIEKEPFTQFLWSFSPFLMNKWSCKVLND